MQSIEKIRASDGSGNASVATVQTLRSSGASTIIVDTVDGINGSFMGSMGTPNTYVDPITAETITVISEATAVDFAGHVDGSNLEIDTVAPGYTDNGSQVGDIVVIRPTTQWSDNVADVLAEEHKDDGTHGDITCDSITINGTASAEGWSPLGDIPDTVTPNGNGSYDLVFNGNDLTDTVSEGMRIRTARTVPASNTSFSLDGTNDYYVKTSPNKMTWTDDFATGWWVYPTAYATSTIASRYNGTSGWTLRLNSSGQVNLIGLNGGSSNQSNVLSYQSLPLNKWTHVAAQLDMSTYTATTTTSYIMINGVDVPVSVSRGGTNPTALIQAGNFEVGSENGGLFPFTGYIGDGGVFSAKVTQATMLGYMNQGLIGTETNLASGYANGSVNDLNTTTPNNLTATNGATTVANAPYGNRGVSTTIDYGIVMKKVFSTNTTLTVQVPEGCTIPTSGGVSSVDYSTQAVPYGFPRDKGRWVVRYLNLAGVFKNSPTINVWYELVSTTIPTGSWRVNYTGSLLAASNGTISSGFITLSTANNTEDASNTLRPTYTSAVGNILTSFDRTVDISLLSATTHYLNTKSDVSGTPSLTLYTSTSINAENAYL